MSRSYERFTERYPYYIQVEPAGAWLEGARAFNMVISTAMALVLEHLFEFSFPQDFTAAGIGRAIEKTKVTRFGDVRGMVEEEDIPIEQLERELRRNLTREVIDLDFGEILVLPTYPKKEGKQPETVATDILKKDSKGVVSAVRVYEYYIPGEYTLMELLGNDELKVELYLYYAISWLIDQMDPSRKDSYKQQLKKIFIDRGIVTDDFDMDKHLLKQILNTSPVFRSWAGVPPNLMSFAQLAQNWLRREREEGMMDDQAEDLLRAWGEDLVLAIVDSLNLFGGVERVRIVPKGIPNAIASSSKGVLSWLGRTRKLSSEQKAVLETALKFKASTFRILLSAIPDDIFAAFLFGVKIEVADWITDIETKLTMAESL